MRFLLIENYCNKSIVFTLAGQQLLLAAVGEFIPSVRTSQETHTVPYFHRKSKNVKLSYNRGLLLPRPRKTRAVTFPRVLHKNADNVRKGMKCGTLLISELMLGIRKFPQLLAICPSLCISRRLQEELDAENRIKNRLPVLSNFLAKMIPQWEAAQGELFLFKGER